ncbi:hypothetical protein F1559_000888 [Cyanidiococcus yangmingshanensis]|uniref:NAD-dependent epimerase/dehydratase domain-containing protein n=1 Tax=Cyanidiococcus yangmingshanensis TaxID=2690220 RepID=A0A7J7IK09_9RHOD|nr:hypothetical protein F1559_000888 [Cyanidiococcus yangmingshanensis]
MTTAADKSVCVTGASGYIGSWLVYYLLERGYTVHATVRDVNRKTEHLKRLAAEHKSRGGQLVLHQADLLSAESFIEPIKQCSVVYHTASPFQISQTGVSGQKRFIDPAVRGTENVLLACLQPETRQRLRRVVVTSSIAAVAGFYDQKPGDPVPVYDENDWNTTSTPRNDPYSYSKTEAERLAWRVATETRNKDKSWDLVTILPGFVLGPSLTKETESGSVEFMQQLLGGRLAMGAPAWQQSVVDVRDVAIAHLRAGSDRQVPSGRYILVAESKSILNIAAALRNEWGHRFRLPQRELPKWLVYLAGPFVGLSWETIRHRVGLPIRLNTAKSKTLLGMEYRDMNRSIVEHAQQMIADGLVTLRP